jgi:hypothetical protein
MPVQRSTIIRGPAIVTFNGATLYSKGDIELELGVETFNVETAMHGKVDERVASRVARIRFTPDGQYESMGVIWPYGAMNLGDSVFTAADIPLVIKTKAGQVLTFSAAAITKMPSLMLGSSKTILGDIEFTALGKDNEAWTVANNLVTVTSAAFSDTSFDPASIITQPYTGVWGVSAPWSSITTFDGWQVDFDLSLNPITTDGDGIVDMTFASLAVTAKCRPIGITETQLITALGLQGGGNARGRSLQTGSSDLVISNTGVTVTVKSAQLKSGPMAFGSGTPRIGELTWVATRKFAAGVASPLFTVA